MSADDDTDADRTETDGPSDVRERIEREAGRALEGFDEGVVDVLSWVLDTETRARIYVYLRSNPESTSDEVAEGTGLYPSTVREVLAELNDEGLVARHKRENEGAGNNPYEYGAIAPSELVRGAVEDLQSQLNAVFNLDRSLNGGSETTEGESDRDGPVTITVERGDD